MDQRPGLPVRDAAGQVTLTSGVATDITSRKEAETALRASEEKFRLAMEAIQEGMWDLYIPSGELYINPGFLRSSGFDPEKDKHSLVFWESTVHPEDFASYRQALQDHLEGRRPDFEAEYRVPDRGRPISLVFEPGPGGVPGRRRRPPADGGGLAGHH